MKRSILTKMLAQILISILVVFVLAAALILNVVQASMTTLITGDLTSKSSAASYQIGDFFTRYTEVVRQMATNAEIVRNLGETKDTTLAQAEDFSEMNQTLKNIAASDTENILYSWIVDADPSHYVQSDGPMSEIGEWDCKTSSWYQQAVSSTDVIITEPYMSTAGTMVVSIVTQVTDSGNPLGFVAVDLSIDKLNKMMESYQLGDTGFFILASKDGMLLHYPDPEMEGKNISEANVEKSLLDAFSAGKAEQLNYNLMGQEVHGYISPVGNTGWIVATGLPSAEFDLPFHVAQKTIFLVFLGGVLLLGVVTTGLAIGIIRPIKKLSVAAGRIAKGELDVSIDVKTKDETGQVAESLRATVRRLEDYIGYIDEISAVLNQMASGNLACQLRLDYVGEFAKIKQAHENITSSLCGTLGQINAAAEQVSSGSNQMAASAQAISQGATEQASAVEELAATINEISVNVKDNAQNAVEVSRLINHTGEEVNTCNQQMNEMVTAMQKINASSQEIGKIIKTIEDIAFQTNILALNAAVEAARAGTSGKGFAVVADEVRNLASKSATAAKNTTALIENSLKAVQQGTQIADSTQKSLLNVVEGATQIMQSIEKITAASKEQADSISQVTQGVDQISAVVQTNSATSEESAAASEELSGQADMMKELVGRFQLENKTEVLIGGRR